MAWFNFLCQCSLRFARQRRPSIVPRLEPLEDRRVPATANLIAYRPVTEYLNYAKFRVPASQEMSHNLGPGIRINRDDDNGNSVADYLDNGITAGNDNDLVRVDVAATGTAAQLDFDSKLRVWTSRTKKQEILSGTPITVTIVWVEYVGSGHTSATAPADLTLTVSDASGDASDKVRFHTFRSVVIAIGGNGQNPAKVGDPSQGVFTIASVLYQRGFDVHMYRHDQVVSSGAGAAYNEAIRAVKRRNVKNVAIFGFSWGGGATYELARGLKANASLHARYTLRYTGYIDGITHHAISSEQRFPPGSAYHDNIYQRRDWLIQGNSVAGAHNVNASATGWGSSLVHTSIDDNGTVRSIIISNLIRRVAR